MLPAKVGTVALERLSLTGPDFYALGTDATRAQLDAMLGKLGKKVTDLTVADAGDPRGLTVIEIGIFRVADAAADRLLSEWVASTVASNPGEIATSSVTVDGRQLTKLVDQSRPVGRRDLRVRQGRHPLRRRRGRSGAPVQRPVPASDPLTLGRSRA